MLIQDYIFISSPPPPSTSRGALPNATDSETIPNTSPSVNIPPSTEGGGEVIALLTTHEASNLEPGLPRKGINASDHIALVAEIDF